MRRKNNSHQKDIEDLKRQNNLLEAQSKNNSRTIILVSFECHVSNNVSLTLVMVFSMTDVWQVSYFTVRTLEKAKTTGAFGMENGDSKDIYNETESDTSDMENSINSHRRPKKMKILVRN